MPASLRSFTDAAADAVAREIAALRREAQREGELRAAEHAARLAQLDARLSAVADLERRLSDRLAALKDGEPGRDGKDGVDGRDGSDGQDGRSVTVADCAPLIASEVERVLATWERPRDGTSVTVEDLAPAIAMAVERAVAAVPAPKDGRDGLDGKDGRDGIDGKDGEPGQPGSPGKLPAVREWSDVIHYEGDVVSHAGSTYQAARDTAKEPPHDDWICIARAGSDGRDGRSFTIRGTWSETSSYQALDVVALGGASFAARRDDPGSCPGEGWQLIAAQGKRGAPGERSMVKGDPGKPAPTITNMTIDDDGLLVINNSDGTTVDCDLYPLLSKLTRPDGP